MMAGLGVFIYTGFLTETDLGLDLYLVSVYGPKVIFY